MYTKEELENLSKLLLSADEANLEIAFELIRQGGATKDLVTELFAIYKMDIRRYKREAKELLEGIAPNVAGLAEALKGRAYLDSTASSSNIKKYVKKCPSIDPKKLTLAIYNKYDSGYQYIFSNFSDDEIEPLVAPKIKGNKLDLVRKVISKIPKALSRFEDLEIIDFRYNAIGSLPTYIDKLKSLKELRLRSNNIKKVNKNIAKLKHLEVLDLCWNKVVSLPDELANMESLKELYLDYNSFKEFPEVVTKIPNLEKFSFTSMMDHYKVDLSAIPNCFFNMKTNRLIELTLKGPLDSNSSQIWGNIPFFTRITGTYDDPISTQPLDLARRAFDQNKEAKKFLIANGTLEDQNSVWEYMLSDLATFNKSKYYWGALFAQAPPEMTRKALNYTIENKVLGFSTYFTLDCLPKEIAEFDLEKITLPRLSKLSNPQGFWDSLDYAEQLESIVFEESVSFDYNLPKGIIIEAKNALPNLKVAHLSNCKIDLESLVEHAPHLEELKLEYMFWAREEDRIPGFFASLEPLKNAKNLTKLILTNVYYPNRGDNKDALIASINETLQSYMPNCVLELTAQD